MLRLIFDSCEYKSINYQLNYSTTILIINQSVKIITKTKI